MLQESEEIVSLAERVLGRFVVDDVVHPAAGGAIVPANTMVEERHMEAIGASGIEQIRIRSVLSCESQIGVCAACYGRDLARGTPVNIGEAVGVIAAQSIGEPGTQLTMRTFHIGGTAQRGAEASSIDTPVHGTVRITNANHVSDSDGNMVVVARNCELAVVDEARPGASCATGFPMAPAFLSRTARRWIAATPWCAGIPTTCRSLPTAAAASPIMT